MDSVILWFRSFFRLKRMNGCVPLIKWGSTLGIKLYDVAVEKLKHWALKQPELMFTRDVLLSLRHSVCISHWIEGRGRKGNREMWVVWKSKKWKTLQLRTKYLMCCILYLVYNIFPPDIHYTVCSSNHQLKLLKDMSVTSEWSTKNIFNNWKI